MPITATSRFTGSGESLRQTLNAPSRSLALASAIQSVDCATIPAKAINTNAILIDRSLRSGNFTAGSVLAPLEQEVAAALVARADRLAVLRLLREVLLHVRRELAVDVDALLPSLHVLQRLHEMPGED